MSKLSKGSLLRRHGTVLDTAKNDILSLLKNVLISIAQLLSNQQNAMGRTGIIGAGYTNGDIPMGTSAAEGTVFTVEVDGKQPPLSYPAATLSKPLLTAVFNLTYLRLPSLKGSMICWTTFARCM